MNSPAQAWQVAWGRERMLLRRRPMDLAMLTLVPLLAVLLTWALFWGGTPRGLPLAVLDSDHSSVSRQLLRLLRASPGLDVVATPADQAQGQALLRQGRVYALLAVPEGFARDIKQGRAGSTVLLHNAQFATHSGLIQRDVRSAVAALSAGVELRARERRGEAAQAARAALEPLRTALTAAYNTGLDYEQFLATTLVPTLLHIFAMVAGAWALGRELRDRTLGTLMGLSHHAAPALLAKLWLPWLALVAIDAAFFAALTAGRGWVPTGPLWAVLLLHALMFAVYLQLGAVAALALRSLRMALSAAGVLTAPAFAYAGVAFPLMAMPAAGQAWALALPITHVLDAQTAVLQLGAPALQAAGPAALALAGVAGVLFGAGAVLLARCARDGSAWGRR